MKIIGCSFFSGELGDQPKKEYTPFHSEGIKCVRSVGHVLDREVLYEIVFEEPFAYPDYIVQAVSFEKTPILKKLSVSVYHDVIVDTQYVDRVTIKALHGLNRAYRIQINGQ